MNGQNVIQLNKNRLIPKNSYSPKVLITLIIVATNSFVHLPAPVTKGGKLPSLRGNPTLMIKQY